MSSKTNPYLISICIPTFNRSDILYQNLPRLLSLQAFDHEVELVISDNASTDNTKAAIEQLKAEFSDKNISYYRNDENIRDRNFLLALSRGKGHYLKLLNDYTSFSNDDLIYMKEKVRVHQNDRDFCLFFFDKIKHIPKNTAEIEIRNVDELVQVLSNKMTWISNFGCFSNQLDTLYQFQERSKLMILQMMWILHLVSQAKRTLLVNITSYQGIRIKDKFRVPYNLFTPHVVNYYLILNEYVQCGLISPSTIKKDKSKVLHDYVGAQIKNYLFAPQDQSFDLSGSWHIIWTHFRHNPYLYILLMKGSFHYIQRKIRRLIAKL